jgi:hypothetical protein
MSRLSNRVGNAGWTSIPESVKAPLYLNPLFFITVSLVPRGQLYPEWFICLSVFQRHRCSERDTHAPQSPQKR